MPLSKWRRFINFTLESVNVDDTKQDQNHFWNTRWNGNKRKFPDDIRGKWLLRTTKQPRSHATLSPSFARGGRENIAHYKYHRLHVWTKMRVLIRETKAIETWIYGYDKRLKCSFSIITYPNVDQYFEKTFDYRF